MNEQERANIRFATKNLIICFICYTLLSDIFISGIVNNIVEDYDLIIQVIVQLIYKAIIIFVIWKIAFYRIMNDCKITKNESNHIFKNILIFSGIIFLISLFISISTEFKKVDEIAQELNDLNHLNYYSYTINDPEFLNENSEALKSTKNKIYLILTIKQVVYLIIMMGIGYLQKNELNKRTL